MAERRAESYAWDEEEEAVRVHIVQQLGPALAAQVSDTMMMRFIRGYYYEEPRAENTLAILRETLQWRQRTGVESMIDEPDEMLLRQSMTYRNLFHLDIYGRDSTGHVIMCQVSAPPRAPARACRCFGGRDMPLASPCASTKKIALSALGACAGDWADRAAAAPRWSEHDGDQAQLYPRHRVPLCGTLHRPPVPPRPPAHSTVFLKSLARAPQRWPGPRHAVRSS
jgi:hypothetical protein